MGYGRICPHKKLLPLKGCFAMVHSPDGDTDVFEIVAGVLQEDTLASLFIICLDYVLQTLTNLNLFHIKKKTTTQDADYINDLGLLANTIIDDDDNIFIKNTKE